MNGRSKFFVLAIMILGSGILQHATLTRGHDWGDDFASYIMQAKSIADGNPRAFIEENRFTVENSTRMIGPAAAPWGTPVALALLYKLFGLNMLALKSLNVASYILFLSSLAFFLRSRHPFPFLVLLVSFFAFNPMFLSFLDSILSDIPFLFLSTACIFLIGRVAVEDRPLFGRAADNLLLGVLLAAAFFTRTNGILLVAALLGAHVVKIARAAGAVRGHASGSTRSFLAGALRSNTKKILLASVPYVTFIVLAFVWVAALPEGGSSNARYLGSVSLSTVLHHLRVYGRIPSDFYLGIPHPRVWYFASFPLFIAGMFRSVRTDYHMILYMVLSAVLFLLWPYTQGPRYILPLMPFYVHFLFVGIRWGREAIGGSRRRAAHVLAVSGLVLVAALFMRGSVSTAVCNMRAHRAAPDGPYRETSREMFDFIRNGTSKDAVIIFFKPRLMRMLTGRPSLAVDEPLEVGRGDYLCFYVMKKPYYQLPLGDMMRLIEGGRLVQVYANPEFRVYRIVHSVGRA